jgi:putative transposase
MGLRTIESGVSQARRGGQRKCVAHLMRRHGLRGISPRHGFTITTRRDKAQRPSTDLVRRRFEAQGPNPLCVAGPTCPIGAGFIYLTVVLARRQRC